MSEAGADTGAAAAVAVAAAPVESLKRELEEPEVESPAKRAHVDEEAVAVVATETAESVADATAEATTEGDAEATAATAGVEADANVAPAVAPPAAVDMCLRLLMTNKMVGMVIGKGGEKIRHVRETSGCRITFSDNYPGVTDRVLMVTGQFEHVKAAISNIVVQLEQDVLMSNSAVPANPTSPNQLSIKLLTPQSQIGAVIGKGGAQLERMRSTTGAQIVAAAEPLPNSTDRPVSLTGPAQAIITCVESCMEIFQEHPAGPGQIQYRPAPAPQAYGGYGPQAGGYGAPQGGPRMAGPGGYGAPQQGMAGGYGAPPQQQTMQQFTIANDLVGCVIGRGGSEINSMRKQSGANIRIHHPEPGQAERLVSVSGSQEQVAMAHYLLTNKLQQEVSSNWAPGAGGAQQQQAPAQQAYY